MRIPSAFSSLAAVAALVAFAAGSGCSDPRYCDVDTPCKDQAYPVCDTVLHECQSTQADAAVDRHEDAGDAQVDAEPVPDGGCESPKHQCGNSCYALTDPAHCGEACAECTTPTNGAATCDGTSCGFTCDSSYYALSESCAACDTVDHCGPACDACGGPTPDCSGHTGKCVCNSTSCTGTAPICDSTTQACRACQAHNECASGVCDRSTGGCVAVSDIIYVDSNDANCDDAGTGTATAPFCLFTPAFQTWSTTTRYCIKVAAGTYSFSGVRVVQDKKLIVVGVNSTSTPTELVQTQGGAMVFQLLQVSGTAELALYGVTVRGGDGASGHGISCTGSSAAAVLSVQSSVVRGNGGRGMTATQCSVMLTQSIVSGNVGGGAYLADSAYTIENCLIVDNGKSGGGGSTLGGVYLSNPGDPAIFINNTVAGNLVKDSADAGGVWCPGGATVKNSILHNNDNAEQNGCTFEYSDIMGWTGGGTGNIADDPLFVDSANGNYHLKTSPLSPAINAGTTTGAPLVDLEGTARTNTPDMGCYEAQ